MCSIATVARRALPELIGGLGEAAAYPHPVGRVRLEETHIAWVLLAGRFAYKVKKPVNLGFLDFSTLALRRTACDEELRINRRWAPELYLDVVPITGTPASPRLGGPGMAIEYAVRMRRFPRGAQIDRRLARGVLTVAEIEAFACALGHAHSRAPVATGDGPYGTVAAVRGPVESTLSALLARARAGRERATLESVRDWMRAQVRDEQLRERLRGGFVREGHGDLHLANLVHWQGRVQAFDAIEFDPALRWIDVLNDVAFLAMDLASRGRRDLACAFLNRYLETTGDHAGLPVLRYYLVYRALVRANIAGIRGESGEAQRYVALAAAWTRPLHPALVLMHGLSGSGKTRLSTALVTALPALRLRSDLERRRVRPLDPAARSGGYGAPAVHATYARLAALAAAVLEGGESVIVDATFLARAERERFRALARQVRVPCVIVACQAPRAILEQRVRQRAAARSDASEADAAVLAVQLECAEALAPEERRGAVIVDTAAAVDARSVARAITAQAAGTAPDVPSSRRVRRAGRAASAGCRRAAGSRRHR